MSSRFANILNDNEGFKPTTVKATRKTTTTQNSRLLSKPAVEFVTQKLLKEKGKKESDSVEVENTKKRQLLVEIIEYYEKFPFLESKLGRGKKRPPLDKTEMSELVRELEEIRQELSHPFAFQLAEEMTFWIMDFGEKFYMKYIFGTGFDHLGNISGLVSDIRSRDADYFRPEILEIAIRWKSWLNLGPYSRLIAKLARKATERRLMSLAKTYGVVDPTPTRPEEGKKKRVDLTKIANKYNLH